MKLFLGSGRFVGTCWLLFFSLWPHSSNSQTTLSLEEAITIALQANHSILNARDQIQFSKYGLESAKNEFSFKISPSASAGIVGGNAIDTDQNLGFGLELSKRFSTGTKISLVPNYQRYDSSTNGGLFISITQPLLRGRGEEHTQSNIYSAEFNQKKTVQDYYLAKVITVLHTVSSVYNVIQSLKVMGHAQDSLQRLKLHITGIKAKAKAGRISSMDLYRAELELRDAENALLLSREGHQDNLDTLKTFLSLSQSKPIEVSAPLDYTAIEIDKTKMLKFALANRIEIEQAEDSLKEAKRLSLIAYENTKPLVDFQAQYQKNGRGNVLDSEFALDEESWGLSLTSSSDLFRRQEKLAYQQSILRVTESRRNLSFVEDQIVQEVKKEYRNLERAFQQIDLQKKRLKQAQGKLALAKIKFRWAKADNFTLIETEKQLRQTQTSLVRTIVNYIVSTYRLRAAMGSLIEKDRE